MDMAEIKMSLPLCLPVFSMVLLYVNTQIRNERDCRTHSIAVFKRPPARGERQRQNTPPLAGR